jgi:hypothetical protein
MPAKQYASWPLNMLGGNTEPGTASDMLTNAIKATLHTGYTPNQTTHLLFATTGVSSTQTTGTGYTAGGATLANKTYTVSSLTTTFTNTQNLVWTTATFNANAIIFWNDTPTTPADPLICYDDFGAQSVSGADFTYQIHASGIFTFTVA